MATKKNVVSIKQDIPEQLEILRADVSKLAETIKLQAKNTVAEKTASVKDVATEKSDIAKARYDEITSRAEARIKEKPLTSIAIAVGAGLVLGALSRR
jgi:ElaB/YqjD/DUF883 family membrane-anchored ribosome-binding protein